MKKITAFLVALTMMISLCSCGGTKQTIQQGGVQAANEPAPEITASDTTLQEGKRAEKELDVNEWIVLKLNGTEIRFRFDGFTPLQDKGSFGTYVMLLCSIENCSPRDFNAYNFFDENIMILDAEGFSLPHSNLGWNYDVYDCKTEVGIGEKKRIVQAFAYTGEVSELTMIISDDECDYYYMCNEQGNKHN